MAHLRNGMPNILVVYYGGTIGMMEVPGKGLMPTDEVEKLLAPLNIKGLKTKINIVWCRIGPKKIHPDDPDAIDSTNARFHHWVSIGNVIKLLYNFFDGFVVVGGTDTMAHLTAALNFMFPNCGKPIIATGAQKSVFELGDDATGNLYHAFLAASSDLRGAHLAFANVLRNGLKVAKVQDRAFAAFTSPTRHIIGEFDGELHLMGNRLTRNPFVTSKNLVFDPRFMEGVSVVELSPSSSSEDILNVAMGPKTSVLLLVTYGAGNVRNLPSYRGELTHIDAMTRLYKMGIPVVLGSPMLDGRVDSPYAPGIEALSKKVGGISGHDITGSALHVKCMVALARSWNHTTRMVNREKFKDVMYTNLVGESDILQA